RPWGHEMPGSQDPDTFVVLGRPDGPAVLLPDAPLRVVGHRGGDADVEPPLSQEMGEFPYRLARAGRLRPEVGGQDGNAARSVSVSPHGYRAPRRRSTAGIVWTRIARSRAKDQLRAYSSSMAARSGYPIALRPLTCQAPVIPGRSERNTAA